MRLSLWGNFLQGKLGSIQNKRVVNALVTYLKSLGNFFAMEYRSFQSLRNRSAQQDLSPQPSLQKAIEEGRLEFVL